MKKVIALLLILMCVIGAAGCQKTPESPIVIGKNRDKMIEQANSLEDKSLTVGEQISAPETIKIEFQDTTGELTFSVDAKVILPDADHLKTIRITSHEITQEEVDTWTEVMFAGETLYTIDSFASMTKKEITEKLLESKKRLAQLDVDDEERIMCETSIAYYEGLLKTAPDDYVLTETTNKLVTGENNSISSVQFAVPQKNGLAVRGFSASNYKYAHPIVYTDRGDTQFTGRSRVFSLEEMEQEYAIATESYQIKLDAYRQLDDPAITSQQAVEMGNDFLTKLAMNGYVINSAELAISEPTATNLLGEPVGNVLKGWRLEYRREIGGVPLISHGSAFQMATPDEGEPWSYERVMLFVTDDGIAEAYIDEQYDIGETLVENCKVMNFDEIMDIFKKMLPIQHNVTAMGDHLINAKWDIISIEFGYTSISEENSVDTGLLVPSWTFYGYHTATYKDDTYSSDMYPVLTINAIDGSIIDRYAGY